ncbi:MAG: ferritin-like domain-containing protein [Oligoflexia bacterium]|nr:ferritin-like domain-containing protein [Oligoflexia bacterium]
MNQQETLIGQLNSLIQLDVDAIHAYDQAIEKIDVEPIRDELEGFKKDHHRHVEELTNAVRRMGGEPVKYERDLTALRSVTGTEGALRAMKSNEKLTNKTYRRALGWILPPEVYDVVRRNRDDEVRHLAYIERALRERFFEETGRAAA